VRGQYFSLQRYELRRRQRNVAAYCEPLHANVDDTFAINQHRKPVTENRFRFLTSLACGLVPNFSATGFR